jgi:ABC-type siderophore export system fused ATPase/permease subunit
LNKVALDRTGAIYWNGKPISAKKLDEYLALMPTMDPEPWIFLETEMGAPCASLDAVRDQIEKRMHCAEGGRCNEGIMTVWDNIPNPPGTPVS